MPHKKRANRNHIRVKKILANNELSLLDKNKCKKSCERVPRRDKNPGDRKREERILNDDSDDNTNNKYIEVKQHINKQLQIQQKYSIPRKSRKNKYYLMNHPELKDKIENLPNSTNKRKHECNEQDDKQNEPVKKKSSDRYYS